MLFEWSLRLLEEIAPLMGLSSMYSSRTVCTACDDDNDEKEKDDDDDDDEKDKDDDDDEKDRDDDDDEKDRDEKDDG